MTIEQIREKAEQKGTDLLNQGLDLVSAEYTPDPTVSLEANADALLGQLFEKLEVLKDSI